MDASKIIESLKGVTGTGNVLSRSLQDVTAFLRTLEPGDIVRSDPPIAVAAPIAYDLWYLWAHMNMMKEYYEDIDGDHYDYSQYLTENLGFLNILSGLKPLKIFMDLQKQLSGTTYFDIFSMTIKTDWANNGVYWINTLAFELWDKDHSPQYPSDGSAGYKNNPNDYVGYITFPIGQLGVMEVISILRETALSGYQFIGVDSNGSYLPKIPAVLQDTDKPKLQSTVLLFPDAQDDNGNALSGQNYCYGKHLIERAYLMPTIPEPSQNVLSSSGQSPYAPQANLDVELFSNGIKDYGEDVKPKLWMRYWIHKDNTFPVPGEFIGILCRPVATPPHVWWYQESSPFLYAGNWMETRNLTSGVVVSVTLEADRTDGGIGNQYNVKIQGCEVVINSTDFLEYSVGDRVAVLKLDSIAEPAATSFRSLDQEPFLETEKLTEITDYVILPCTYYKLKQ